MRFSLVFTLSTVQFGGSEYPCEKRICIDPNLFDFPDEEKQKFNLSFPGFDSVIDRKYVKYRVSCYKGREHSSVH